MRRRTVLASAALSLASVAGCQTRTTDSDDTGTRTESPSTRSSWTAATGESAIEPSELDGHVRPDSDPDVVPGELTCDDDEFERRRGWIDGEALQWGTVSDGDGTPVFALRVDRLAASRGETVAITLTNVSATEQVTGNVYKANLDVRTEAGWQDPRGWPDGLPKPVNDDLWEWDPGEDYTLTFELSPEGVVEGDYDRHEDDLVTCPGLPPGRYRFGTAAPEQGDIAVAFDLMD